MKIVLAAATAFNLLLYSQPARAEGSVLSPLPESACTAASSDQREVSLAGAANVCLLAFSGNGEGEITANINGELLQLFLVKSPASSRNKSTTVFKTKDGRVSIALSMRGTGSSCVEGEDKCCGQAYEGTLSFRDGRKASVYPVAYYRGG